MRTRPAFTMVELLVSVFILSFVVLLSSMLYNAIANSWATSTEMLDREQHADYALEQVVSGLRSAYYPHDGKQADEYGFQLTDNGDGETPRESDVIEWAKTGSAIVGDRNSTVLTVHRVQLMVLEEGNRDYAEPIETTGLYARMCPDPALRPKKNDKDDAEDYTFANSEIYQPMLVAEGIVGFNCRVMKSPDDADADVSKAKFEDEWTSSNAIPYKVELTFWVKDPEAKSYRTNTAPVKRIVRMPLYEQSQDGNGLPGEEKKDPNGGRRPAGGGATGGGGGTGNGSPTPAAGTGGRPGGIGGGRPNGIGGGRPGGISGGGGLGSGGGGFGGPGGLGMGGGPMR